MFTLQIQCGTIEDAERILAALKHSANPAVVEALAEQIPNDGGVERAAQELALEIETKTAIVAAEKPKRGRPRREVAEKPAAPLASLPEKQDPAAAPRSEVEVEGSTTQQAPTLDDARAALKGVQAKYGTDDMSKPLEVLGQFSAGRISEVKPEQYPAFIAACKAA